MRHGVVSDALVVRRNPIQVRIIGPDPTAIVAMPARWSVEAARSTPAVAITTPSTRRWTAVFTAASRAPGCRAVEEHDDVTRLPDRKLKAAAQQRIVRIGQVLDDQGDRVAAIGDQRLREVVGLKIELLHHAQNVASSGERYRTLSGEHVRNGCLANPCSLGDRRDRRARVDATVQQAGLRWVPKVRCTLGEQNGLRKSVRAR